MKGEVALNIAKVAAGKQVRGDCFFLGEEKWECDFYSENPGSGKFFLYCKEKIIRVLPEVYTFITAVELGMLLFKYAGVMPGAGKGVVPCHGSAAYQLPEAFRYSRWVSCQLQRGEA